MSNVLSVSCNSRGWPTHVPTHYWYRLISRYQLNDKLEAFLENRKLTDEAGNRFSKT